MATLANLFVVVSGNTAKLDKSLQQAQTRTDKFRSRAGLAFRAVRTAALGLAVAGGASLVAFGVTAVKSFLDTGDELDKMSKRLGISVESLSELKFAAEQSGASLDDIEKGVKKLSSSVFDANNGIKASSDAFRALGLNARELAALSPEEQFLAVAEALAKVESASTRAALAQDIFGRAGTTLLPLVAEGAEGLEALRQKARDLGNTFTTEGAASAAAFKDAINELKQRALGLGQGIGQFVIPTFTVLVSILTENTSAQTALAVVAGILVLSLGILAAKWIVSTVATAANTVALVANKVAQLATTAAGKAGLAVIGARTALTIASTVATVAATIATGAFGIAVTLALSPIGLIVIALAALVAAIILVYKNWDTIWPIIQRVFDVVSGAIIAAYRSNFGWLLPGGILIKALLFFQNNWERIWVGVQNLWQTVTGAIKRAYQSNLGWLLPGGFLIKALLFLQNNWQRIWGGIRAGFSAFVSPIERIIDGLRSTLDSLFSALSRVQSAISAALSALSNLPGAGVVGAVVNAIPGFASGVQNFRGGMALVGERGPELVNLPRGSDVIPSGRGGSSMTTVVNMNFYGDIYGDDFDRRVNEARLRWERAGNA